MGLKIKIMKHNIECISDDNGVEIYADYAYDQGASQIEECHGRYEVGLMIYTELKSVNVIIENRSIDILPLMTEKQKDYIIDNLQYE